jgi:hypothetical protein
MLRYSVFITSLFVLIFSTNAQTFKNSYSVHAGVMFSDFPIGYYFQNKYSREKNSWNYWVKFGIANIPGGKYKNDIFNRLSYGNYANIDLGASIIPINKPNFRFIIATGISGRFRSEFYPQMVVFEGDLTTMHSYYNYRGYDIGFIINIMPEFKLTEQMALFIDLNFASYNNEMSQKFTGLGLNYKF